MRVVFDTNVLIAGLVFPEGQGARALQKVIVGTDRLALSDEILDELLGVLARKFARDGEQLARVAVFIAELAEFVRPRITLEVLADGPDNRVLECAVAANANCIVTGDKAMLALREFQGIRVMTLASASRRPGTDDSPALSPHFVGRENGRR
jgi:putative PIN family toxin of toxin-antitoxin system